MSNFFVEIAKIKFHILGKILELSTVHSGRKKHAKCLAFVVPETASVVYVEIRHKIETDNVHPCYIWRNRTLSACSRRREFTCVHTWKKRQTEFLFSCFFTTCCWSLLVLFLMDFVWLSYTSVAQNVICIVHLSCFCPRNIRNTSTPQLVQTSLDFLNTIRVFQARNIAQVKVRTSEVTRPHFFPSFLLAFSSF